MSFATMLWALAASTPPGTVVPRYYLMGTGQVSDGNNGPRGSTAIGYRVDANNLLQPIVTTVFASPGLDENRVQIPDPDTWTSVHGNMQILSGLKGGKAYNAGDNQYGAILSKPIDTHQQLLTLVPFDGSGYVNENIIQLMSGREHTAALRADGKALAWGYNLISSQCFKDERTVYQRFPVCSHDMDVTPYMSVYDDSGNLVRRRGFPDDTVFKKMAVGDRFNLFIDQHKQGWSISNNGYRQCGRATVYSANDPWKNGGYTKDPYFRRFPDTDPNTNYSAPGSALDVTQYVMPDLLEDISAGSYHGAAITTEGKLIMWGAYDDGQTTLSTRIPDYIPSPEPGVPFAKISLGEYSTSTILANGHAYVCGRGSAGQLGLGDTSGRTTLTLLPVPAVCGPGVGWKEIWMGNKSGCGITTDSKAFAWGDDGTTGRIGFGGVGVVSTPRQLDPSKEWRLLVPMLEGTVALIAA